MIGAAGEERGVIPRAIDRLYARACELQELHGWSIVLKVRACHPSSKCFTITNKCRPV